MLYIMNESTFSGYNDLSLDIIYVIAILLGILVILLGTLVILLGTLVILLGTLVIISKNPIISVLFLIGLFLSISCYLILTG